MSNNKKKDIFSIGDSKSDTLSRQEYKVEWIENSYSPEQKEEEYLSSNFDTKKLRWLFFIIVIVFFSLFLRVGYLQIAKGDEYRIAAEDNRIRIHEVSASRGIIYDRDNNILARNIPNFVLKFTPADLPEDQLEYETLISSIANILEKDAAEISNIIDEQPDSSYQAHLLYEHIPYDQAILLRITSNNLPGISLETTNFRDYLTNKYFSHILGYMSKISSEELAEHPDYLFDDTIGKAGIEFFYESELRGKNGKKEIEVNSLGKESKIVTQKDPEPGINLILTIDSKLQNTLGEALEKTVQNSQGITGAAAIAINPNNGAILALISEPGFDNNSFNLGLSAEEYQKLIEDPDNPLFNRAISGEYPSGSTVKPLIALGALEEGIITPNTTFISSGGIQIDKWFFPDWKAGGHGTTNLKKAIAESVNTYFYLIGGGNEDMQGLGIDRIKPYLELFGLNSALGIDLPGEATGFLPTKEWKEVTKNESWYIGDTYHLSIGQGDLLVTPLQVTNYIATIANGGTFYKPHLVKSSSNADGSTNAENQPEILNDNFIASSHYTAVKEGLREAVLTGSARSLGDLPVTSAGKTGTAQFGNRGKTHAWFTAFAPYENPEIAITVLVEGGGEGTVTALPVVKQGLKSWFSEAR